MTKGITAAIAAALAVTVTVPAFAGGIEERQRNQQRRIVQGVRCGSLTPAEAARLEREQYRIERMERRLKEDGDFTCRDRARVQHRLNHSSRHIFRSMHNRRGAP